MEKLIEICGLSKAYGKKQALHNVDMVFEGGQIIGLLGPNGSGKTTLLKVMTGLLKDYDGVVRIDGKDIGADTKAVVSYLPDEPYFSDWMKVKDALASFVDMYADFDLDKCLSIMSRFQIDESMRIKTMSKGTKEKFQLALVMSRKAKIIVLDEPIGGVDPAAREVILDTILENYSADQTILIATHLIADIERIFSTVVFIKNGQIVLNKEVEEVRQETGKSIDELFREEFRY
ncbi:MAG: ABC transporter ATP-binding protein [Clostridium sp.]